MENKYAFFAVAAVVVILAALLQIYLSTRKNIWGGLLLPVAAFWFALTIPAESVTEFISYPVFLIIANIPTMIFLAIYGICQGRVKSQDTKIKR